MRRVLMVTNLLDKRWVSKLVAVAKEYQWKKVSTAHLHSVSLTSKIVVPRPRALIIIRAAQIIHEDPRNAAHAAPPLGMRRMVLIQQKMAELSPHTSH